MNEKQLSDEFEFLRDKIEKVCSLMINGVPCEAAFVLGRLHAICHNHHLYWKNLNNSQINSPGQCE